MASLTHTQSLVAEHMDAITELFKPEVKVTVIVRPVGFPDRDFLMTSDTIAELRQLLDRREAADPTGAPDGR